MCYTGFVAASPSSDRRRGGQPGNQNALKHGFYAAPSPALPSSEGDSLSLDLQIEIAIIRQSIRSILALGEPQTYRQAVDFLRALSLASNALARLVRTHHYLFPPPSPRDELANATSAALLEIGARLAAGESPTTRPPRRPRPRPPLRFHRRLSKPASIEQP
jgi:hypothetical protein